MKYQTRLYMITLLIFTLLFALAWQTEQPVQAQEEETEASSSGDAKIQEFTGYLHPEDHYHFDIPNLYEGDMIYVLLENVSGNLDPYATIHYEEDNVPLMEDDDSGHGNDARFSYEIPKDGTYTVTISDCCDTYFGEYRLVVGLNAPEVIGDEFFEPTGEEFVFLDLESSHVSLAVQEFFNGIDSAEDFFEHELVHLNAGHTLYVYIESLTEGFVPDIQLKNFSRKILAEAVVEEGHEHSHQSFAYPITESGDHYDILVKDYDGETVGEYRLLLGIDAPEVLTGEAIPIGDPIIQETTEIQVGVELMQITGVDQAAENFSVVAIFRAEWVDHQVAFDTGDCQCMDKVFADRQLVALLEQNEFSWPDFRIINQQGERVQQHRVLTIHHNGTLFYEEVFDATLQAPEFDFRPFPFDHQDFWIRIETREHDDIDHLVIYENPDFNSIGEKLGEEEWLITEFETKVTVDDDGFSLYSFDIRVKRHLTFYAYRIFVPLTLIVFIGWSIFFIPDYDARIGAASGNLLIFVAFNFVIGESLPRLGYLTFLDLTLMFSFVAATLVFGMTVYLRWLVTHDKIADANRVDKIMRVVYPVSYAAVFFILAVMYIL